MAPPEPACAVHDPDSLYSKLFTSILPLNSSDKPCYEEESLAYRDSVSSSRIARSASNVVELRKPHIGTPFNTQFIGQLDELAQAAGMRIS